ncbi:unnamed protein product [Adineta ricciae]|uniref:Uncharacterized protein n=1 Tax=Adineta ricciae TaxID=249248 RepID=A0A815CHT0_ADIRI|nr:unnamed protein product [Adineta ricciae]CAF1549872.1 unnamed protein product [Adineta ricciae]
MGVGEEAYTVLDDVIAEQQPPLPSPSQTSINEGSQNDIEQNIQQILRLLITDRIFPVQFRPESRRAVPEPTQISTDPVAGMIDLG